ncbi:MAG: acyltransferase [Acidobacteriota bacterium]|nr:acyltransferase [Acidobacteriota bacterium]
MIVVVTHATDLWVNHAKPSLMPQSWGNGAVGVDVFFVISGFVMTMSAPRLLHRQHPARLFLWRRVARIVPLYWLLTSVRLALTHASRSLMVHGATSTWNIVASYLFLPSYSVSGDIRPVIPVGWTLNFEMMFYALFALALGLRLPVLVVLVPVLGALSILGFFLPPHPWAILAYADPVVLDFLAGVLIAMTVPQWKRIARVWRVLAACVGIALMLGYTPSASISVLRILIIGGGAALLVGGTVASESDLRPVLPRWLLFLGDASYSIYLLQGFTLPLAAVLLGRAGVFAGRFGRTTGEALCVVVGLLVTLIFASLLYQWIELPMTNRLKQLPVARG